MMTQQRINTDGTHTETSVLVWSMNILSSTSVTRSAMQQTRQNGLDFFLKKELTLIIIDLSDKWMGSSSRRGITGT